MDSVKSQRAGNAGHAAVGKAVEDETAGLSCGCIGKVEDRTGARGEGAKKKRLAGQLKACMVGVDTVVRFRRGPKRAVRRDPVKDQVSLRLTRRMPQDEDLLSFSHRLADLPVKVGPNRLKIDEVPEVSRIQNRKGGRFAQDDGAVRSLVDGNEKSKGGDQAEEDGRHPAVSAAQSGYHRFSCAPQVAYGGNSALPEGGLHHAASGTA